MSAAIPGGVRRVAPRNRCAHRGAWKDRSMPAYEGSLTTQGRFAIVASKFNIEIVDCLIAGAKDGLRRHGVAEDAIDLAWVPGSFEIPLVAQKLAGSKKYAARICLGSVLLGETAQSHYVSTAHHAG